ncbi:MAG: DegT/DnrJ/EryC1/StrS family aminotransferase [Anaerolineae bacterium]|nr:DegT/DnrJ/EryC1/StrS family aminotransferase [Anaerolineae bacterium]
MDANVPFVDLKAQYSALAEEVNAAIARVMQRGDFILGEDVRLFEQEFARWCGVSQAIGVDSGTSALELVLRAYDIGPGDEVITAANTFIATVFAITYTGARPILVDIDPDHYTLDVAALERAITPRTRAVIPVHLYGQAADMDDILAVAARHGLKVIEDACQAHGALYKGRRAGSLADAAAFSFYPAKNLGAYGDGGMIVTDDPALAECLRMMRNYGQSRKYYHDTHGYNRRLDTLQAAVLRVKFRHIDAWNAARRSHAAAYTALLQGAPVITPQVAPYNEAVWHLYVIRTGERDELARQLSEQGIATGIHYPVPIHLQKCCQNLGYGQGDFPLTERYAKEILSLPMYAELSDSAITGVAHAIQTILENLAHPVPL